METAAKKRTTKDGYIEAVGRRKTSIARVRITPAHGGEATEEGAQKQIIVNEKTLSQYFPLKIHHRMISAPFQKADLLGKFSVTVKVNGGGVASQAGAIRHGIARALINFDANLRSALKKFGYLTRDPRMVERKKYGLKKARRAPQWSKR